MAHFRTVPGPPVSNHQGTYSSEDLPVVRISTASYSGKHTTGKAFPPKGLFNPKPSSRFRPGLFESLPLERPETCRGAIALAKGLFRAYVV